MHRIALVLHGVAWPLVLALVLPWALAARLAERPPRRRRIADAAVQTMRRQPAGGTTSSGSLEKPMAWATASAT